MQTFSITGFPCSGMDWLARLLSLHPAILVVDAPSTVGRIGSAPKANRDELRRAATAALVAAHATAAERKPTITHLGIVALHGDVGTLPGPEIVVLRDGRDVLVQWTLAQLTERGGALVRFLDAKEGNRMPEVARRFAADPQDVIARNPGLLLCDYEWVRYGSYLWDEQVTGHASMLGAIADGKCAGPAPCEVVFEAARQDPRRAFDACVRHLGLDPAAVAAFATRDPVAALEPDGARRAAWEIGGWRRYFTPRAAKLFRMDAWQAWEYVTGDYGNDEWEGDCAPYGDRGTSTQK